MVQQNPNEWTPVRQLLRVDESRAVALSAVFAGPRWASWADGLAVTCAHVFGGGHAEPLSAMLPDGSRAEFEVVAIDAAHDLALIRVESLNGPSTFLSISPREPVAGESLRTVTKAGIGQAEFKGKLVDSDVGEAYELMTTLGPGASGGVVVDSDGRLVGVIRGAVDDDPGQTVAIPASRVAEIIASRPAE
jgi:S1-C subfamily serine protease